MSYVKLDTAILSSTLWEDRGSRDVFITMLLMAEPVEITVPMPVIAVRTLDLTGFVVPPGWYGFVPAAGPGIVRRALVPAEEGTVALERLSAPDVESRSRAFDGRRIARVDGGYLVLNYMTYREKDHTAASRAARYRKRKRSGDTELLVEPAIATVVEPAVRLPAALPLGACHSDGVTSRRHAVTSRNVTDAVTASASSSSVALEQEQDQEPVGREERHVPDPLDRVLDEAGLDMNVFADADAKLVRAFLRGQRSPLAVALTLRSHLVDEEVSPRALALAVQEYMAKRGNDQGFEARYFAGFVRRAVGHVAQKPMRQAARQEERFIASEDVEAERTRREEAETAHRIAEFARRHGEQYEAFMAEAELAVDPRWKGLIRTPLVRAALVKLISTFEADHAT